MPTVVGRDKPDKCICRKCRSILEYYPNEVQKYESYSYDGWSDTIRYIKCPVCLEDVIISRI